jgi:hypothetical protein
MPAPEKSSGESAAGSRRPARRPPRAVFTHERPARGAMPRIMIAWSVRVSTSCPASVGKKSERSAPLSVDGAQKLIELENSESQREAERKAAVESSGSCRDLE